MIAFAAIALLASGCGPLAPWNWHRTQVHDEAAAPVAHVQVQADKLLLPAVFILVGGVVAGLMFPKVHWSKGVIVGGALLLGAALILPEIAKIVGDLRWPLELAAGAAILFGLYAAYRRWRCGREMQTVLLSGGL